MVTLQYEPKDSPPDIISINTAYNIADSALLPAMVPFDWICNISYFEYSSAPAPTGVAAALVSSISMAKKTNIV